MGVPNKFAVITERGITRQKIRASDTSKGTRLKPLPNAGAPGPHRPKKWQAVLAENARTHRASRKKG